LLLAFDGEARAASREAAGEGEYTVVAEILPIMNSPGGEYAKTGDGGIEYGDDIEGVVVYGNKLTLRPECGWFALISPDDGSVLGYIPEDGVEPFPDCEPTRGALYMALRDGPELSLMPGGGKSDLPGRDFSLLKGEIVPSYGKRDGYVLMSFGTVDGESGVGRRFAWGRGEDFIVLDSYEPDNSKADRALIPSSRRLRAEPGGAENIENLPERFADSLEKRGFLIDDKALLPDEYGVRVDDMADLYSLTGEYEADFITADIFLHSFHLIFDQMLQKFERTYLAPQLAENLNGAIGLVDAARKRSDGGDAARRSFDTAHDMLSVAQALLSENPAGEKLSPRAAAETEKIMAASEMEVSGITGQKIDYTLFKPRGHYTISPEYERYFRAMSYVGLAELPMFGMDGKPIAHNVAAAAAIALAMDAQRGNWETFEDAMTLLIGVPNAGDPKIYRGIVRKRLGDGGQDAWALLGDEAVIARLAEDIAENVSGPKIRSVAGIDAAGADFESRSAVFRISPKRFTYDAYIMNRLTSPSVGTDENPRNMPKGTDVMAVFGSSAADALSKNDYDIENYEASLAELKDEAAGYLAGENTVYASWLETFLAGFKDSGSEQFFYGTEGWRWKKLATNLASWAELKHDTILYAEQSMAEMGEGGDNWYAGGFEPPRPRGYVEPDPQFFSAMLGATDNLRAFIEGFGVEDNDGDGETKYSDRLGKFSAMLESMRDIARKEVTKETLSPGEYASIKETARAFDRFLLLPGYGMLTDDGELRKMACVADTATNGWDMTVLEAASGTPRAIYVFANDKSGGARVTKGYVFSYYEFERSVSERMTDEEWKAIVYDPGRENELERLCPDWYREFKENTR
ncbi:MAG: DUF3160 domain-containing protein, partial [Synergistaceae bacterium]|nr:DUF3160 domain-containing protein [Synergistaceae bacterium]